MKVLHITTNLGSGGAEKLIEESLPIMKQRKGIEVDLLLLTDDKNVFGKKLKESNISIEIIPLKNPLNPLNILQIRKHIIKGNYDIVHAHLFPTFYWVSIASKIIFDKKPKFVFTEHSTYNRRRELSYLKIIEKIIHSSYDKIISISKDAQENLIDWLRPANNKIDKFLVINNGINLEAIQNAKPYNKKQINYKFTDSTKILCMVGRFSDAKDQGTIIRAMNKLDKNIHLLLVGEGELKKENEILSREIGVEDRVHFLGFRNDIERILKTSDINLLSSHWEGLSLSSIEGMASGKPFIASRVKGIKDVVSGAGLLFNEGNYIELAKIIDELFNNHNMYIDVSKKCLERSLNYDINLMVDETTRLYTSLIQENLSRY